MKVDEKLVAKIVKEITGIFTCFGGGDALDKENLIASALKHAPAMFAAGVDISAVVRLVLHISDKEKK